MMNRIKWEEDSVKDNDGNESPNKSFLVWEVSMLMGLYDIDLFLLWNIYLDSFTTEMKAWYTKMSQIFS